MRAAVVTSFDNPPRYQEFPEPLARGKGEVVVEVLAAGLHPRVRSQADGSHYTSTGELPFVPGIDAVVRDQEGHIRYTILSRRIDFRRGQSVLILGATGNAGRMAVQVARRFGASRVIALGRDAARLEALKALGADETLTFDQVAEAADVDVVIDYLWGEPAVVGSGIGSVPGRDFVRELPKLAGAVADGAFDARARAVPLRDAEQAWTETLGTSDRVVFVP